MVDGKGKLLLGYGFLYRHLSHILLVRRHSKRLGDQIRVPIAGAGVVGQKHRESSPLPPEHLHQVSIRSEEGKRDGKNRAMSLTIGRKKKSLKRRISGGVKENKRQSLRKMKRR